jgi:Mrp family chromosome partitioning ATPase
LRLVTVGGLTDRSADLFEANVLMRTMARIRDQAEVVVVDSAPIRAISDAITLARLSDITLVVADLRRTHRADASAVGQDLRTAESQTIVGVLNNVPRSLRKHQARSRVPGGPKSLAPAASVPSVLAAAVPARGPNGKDRATFGASELGRHGPAAGPDSGDQGD